MSTMMAGTIRRVGLAATVMMSLGGAAPGWAQSAATCNKAAATACTDQKVVECQSQHSGNQQAIAQCQMQVNIQCYQQNNCPTSAR
jgi:hypothetical protein